MNYWINLLTYSCLCCWYILISAHMISTIEANESYYYDVKRSHSLCHQQLWRIKCIFFAEQWADSSWKLAQSFLRLWNKGSCSYVSERDHWESPISVDMCGYVCRSLPLFIMPLWVWPESLSRQRSDNLVLCSSLLYCFFSTTNTKSKYIKKVSNRLKLYSFPVNIQATFDIEDMSKVRSANVIACKVDRVMGGVKRVNSLIFYYETRKERIKGLLKQIIVSRVGCVGFMAVDYLIKFCTHWQKLIRTL